MALGVPKPDSVTTGAGQATQGTCTREKQTSGPWGRLGLAHPAHPGRTQQPEKAQREGEANTHQGGAWHPFPWSQLPKEPGGRPRRRAVSEVPGGDLYKPSWTPSLNPSPHPCWAGELGQPQARCTKAPPSAAPKNAAPYFTRALRPSHPFLLSRSLLSPPLRSPSPQARFCQ